MCILNTLFDENGKMQYLNFQNLKENRGIRIAYKTLYGIDIMTLLDDDTNVSNQKWEKLIKLFNDRHKIIHFGKNTTLEIQEIIEILDSLDLLKSKVKKLVFSP